MHWFNKLKPGDYLRATWDSLPLRTFIDLDRLESFRTKHTSLLVKIQNSIASIDLQHQQIGELPFGNLHLVTCGGIAVAYNIFAPACKKRVGRNYAALMLRGKPPAEVNRLFIDNTLIVLGDDSAMLASITTKQWLD